MKIAEFIDFAVGNVALPVTALLTCIFMGYVKSTDMLYDEITISERFRAESLHRIMVVIIVPVLLALILITGILDMFGVLTF